MSQKHFSRLQKLINEIEQKGYKEITDEVNDYYEEDFFHICVFERPFDEIHEGPLYCKDIQNLVDLHERLYPEVLRKQIWFCQSCREVGMIRYRKHASIQEVVESLHRHHHELSPCEDDFQVVFDGLTPEDAKRADFLPAWAKEDIISFINEK